MMSAQAQDKSRAPLKRCAIAQMGDTRYLFVVVPKPKPRQMQPPPPPPAPAPELEMLMFFDSHPASPPAPPPPPTVHTPASPAPPPLPDDTERYAPGNKWDNGSTVIPVVITGNGDLCLSTDFTKTEFDSLAEVYSTCGPFDAVSEFHTLFGCVVLDKAYVLVASQVAQVVELPFSGVIQQVVETRWIPFELAGVAPVRMSQQDRNHLREFQEYSFGGGYYYSDDVDLRLQFPFVLSRDTASMPSFKCDWSEHLRQPFRTASLRTACSVLVRGFANERVCAMKDGVTKLHVVLLGRQNNVNPGPRYLGRGLNVEGGAGNDHFYEYVIWKQKVGENAITYSRHAILRGTIPVHWQTHMSMSISEPAMIFSSNKADVLKGSTAYFENLFTNLQQVMGIDSAGRTARNPQVRCINLLRLNPQNGEDTLAKYFLEAVRGADPVLKQQFPRGSLDLVHVDWLNIIKEYGIDVAVSTFWESALGFLGQPGDVDDAMFTIGILKSGAPVEHLISQSRFVRVNCADSLDRTNLGCFFTCLQATIGMLITLQIAFNAFADERPLPALNSNDEGDDAAPYSAAFAPVSGAKQIVPKPFLNTWTEARDPRRVPPAVVRALAELFIGNGDCIARLYTNSQAMHGNILRGLCGMRLTASNAVIATQRKFENAFEDRKKFRNIELLLGRNHDNHFPSMSQVYLTRPVPYSQWGSALIAVGIPVGTTQAEVDSAIRRTWDTNVVPWLRQNNQAPIESSALCVTITLQGSGWEELDEKAFAETVGQLSFDEPPPPEVGAEEESYPEPVRSEHIVVIEFDPSFCTVVNAPTLLRQHGILSLRGHNCILAPYAYPIQTAQDGGGGGMGGAVKSVGTSLKRGLKNFVRGLN